MGIAAPGFYEVNLGGGSIYFIREAGKVPCVLCKVASPVARTYREPREETFGR